MQNSSGKDGEVADVFYSQRLLAKDGPLGTVWLAAHFYRKLRKLHITKTRIPSSVDVILQSEVPIALRLLGYLLIGVVRIYAKKVEYVYHDCNEALLRIRNSCTLGKSKPHKESLFSPAFSFTIPERFELDSFNLEEDLDERNHASVNQQITQDDGHAKGANQSLSMPMMLHQWGDTSTRSAFSLSRDVFSPEAMDIDLEISYQHRLSDAEASMEKLLGHKSHGEEILDLEILCQPINSYNIFQMHDDVDNDVNRISSPEKLCNDLGKPDFVLSDDLRHLSNYDASREKVEELQLPCVGYVPRDKCCEASEVEIDKFEKSLERLDLYDVLPVEIEEIRIPAARSPPSPVGSLIFHHSVDVTPEVLLIPTPKIKEPALRKRKYPFDGAVVLSNEVIRQGLHDASSLVRKRKKTRNAVLNVWNGHKVSILQHNFLEPINPYIPVAFEAIFRKEFSQRQSSAEIGARETTSGSADIIFQVNKSSDDVMLPNEALNDQLDPSPGEVPETIKEVIFETTSQSRRELGLHTSTSPNNESFIASESCGLPVDPLMSLKVPDNNGETKTLPSTEIWEPGAEGGTSDIGLDLLAEAVCSNEDCQNQDWWSVRTRAVGRFLQNSFLDQRQQIERSHLNLTKIVEGRSRRICARLFYETLVLKSRGYIDVKQDLTYGDIFLLATPLTKSI